MAPNEGESGYILLEVLAAVAVLAVSLPPLIDLARGALDATGRAAALQRATVVAQARLAAVGRDVSVMPGRQSGVLAGGGRWEVAITPAEGGLAVVAVTVSEDRGTVTLTTLKPLER